MRTIDTHKANVCNEHIDITVMDEPGPGGACHDYALTIMAAAGGGPVAEERIRFQNGPIKEVGTNGLTHESLIAVLIDRMEGFQSGPFANDCNERALEHLRGAQDALLSRTREREARGVEGTHAV